MKGQVSSCDIVLLSKCHNVPGVNVTDRGPYRWDNTTPGGGPCKDVGVKGDIADAGVVKTNHGLRFCGTLSLDQYSGLHNNNNSFFIKLFKFILHFLPYNDTAKEI